MKKENKKTFNPATTISALALLIAVLVGIIFYQYYQTTTKEIQILTFKNNATNAQLYNLQTCFSKGDLECPEDKYTDSSRWKKEINKLLSQ